MFLHHSDTLAAPTTVLLMTSILQKHLSAKRAASNLVAVSLQERCHVEQESALIDMPRSFADFTAIDVMTRCFVSPIGIVDMMKYDYQSDLKRAE